MLAGGCSCEAGGLWVMAERDLLLGNASDAELLCAQLRPPAPRSTLVAELPLCLQEKSYADGQDIALQVRFQSRAVKVFVLFLSLSL